MQTDPNDFHYAQTDLSELIPLFEVKCKEVSAMTNSKQKKTKSLIKLNPPSGFIQQMSPIHVKVCGDAISHFFDIIFSEYIYIEEVTFECVFISNICLKENLNKLQKLKKLTTLNISYNNINSYLDLINLENLLSMTRLSISNNPICSCSLLKYFIFYRFSKIKHFNNILKKEKDVNTTKEIYLKFDKLLKKPGKYQKKKSSDNSTDKSKLAKNAAVLLVNSLVQEFDHFKNFDAAIDQVICDHLDSGNKDNDTSDIQNNE